MRAVHSMGEDGFDEGDDQDGPLNVCVPTRGGLSCCKAELAV